MKKNLGIIIALIAVLTVVTPILTSCQETTLKSIEVVNPITQYKVGDTINYDNLTLKVVYSDGSEQEKTVGELNAEVSPADLSKAGKTSYTITYRGVSCKVDIVVTEKTSEVEKNTIIAIEWPDFYENYIDKSSVGDGDEEEGDFRLAGQAYEVGNVNKFVYRPQGMILSEDIAKSEVETYAEVSVKNTPDEEYRILSEAEAMQYVAIDKNTYKFNELAGGKYFRLKIFVDEKVHDLSSLEEPDKYHIVEFKVVDGGYNVYDQIGLSVMSDLEKEVYSEIWKCDVLFPGETYQVDGSEKTVGENEVKLLPNEDSLILPADDKYLCEYVDNITTVILHESFELDPDLMPSRFFWTEFDKDNWTLTGDFYTEAYESLNGFPEAQKAIVGSLRDGYNATGDLDGPDRARSYMRLIDTRYVDANNHRVPGGYAIELNIGLNMQKGIYSTKKVNVSGNYNSITTPSRGERSAKKNRVLESYADYEPAMTTDPVSHWALFQMLQSRVQGSKMQKFEIRNIALQGNNSYFNDSSENYFHQAGLMLCNNYAREISFRNVNANSFYTFVSGDNYGDYTYKTSNGENIFDESGKRKDNATLTIENSKFYDAYSNMVFLWRSHAVIDNSELKRSGGPLFIMSDADHAAKADSRSDEGGPTISVDKVSKLEAFATGNESWYKIFQAQDIFLQLGGIMTPPLQSVNKTFYKKNDQGKDAINIIAVMLCSPDMILTGRGSSDSKNEFLDVRGKFTQTDENGEILNEFSMHNDKLVDFRSTIVGIGMNAQSFVPVVQSGNQFAYVAPPEMTTGSDGTNYSLSDLEIKLLEKKYFKKYDEETLANWQQGASDKLCMYLSAGPIVKKDWLPYIGIITDLFDITEQ